jgi:hypothetical protein
MYNEKLRNARIIYTDAALSELNAVCNVIENDDRTKDELLGQRAQQLGIEAGLAFQAFLQEAFLLYPDNPALAGVTEALTGEVTDLVSDNPGNEN